MDAPLGQILDRLARIEARLEERCGTSFGRIEALEQSMVRQGERLGKLEVIEHRRKGGVAAMAAMLAAAGTIGAIIAKVMAALGGR